MTRAVYGAVTPPEVLLNELDEFARQWEILHRQEAERQTCRRDKPRRKFRTPCDVWYFEERGTHLKHQTAQTRNISERGLSIVTRTLIHPGSPTEVRISLAGREPSYLGGIVVFCRYVSPGYHEVGIALKAHEHHPIFSDDVTGVIPPITWLQEALRESSARKRPTGKRKSNDSR